MLVYKGNEEAINYLATKKIAYYHPELSAFVLRDHLVSLEIDNTLDLLDVYEDPKTDFIEYFDELKEILSQFFCMDFSDVDFTEENFVRFLNLERDIDYGLYVKG